MAVIRSNGLYLPHLCHEFRLFLISPDGATAAASARRTTPAVITVIQDFWFQNSFRRQHTWNIFKSLNLDKF